MAKSDAVNYLILRSIPRAAYSPQDAGHYGLALENYAHFTSPIRRYADVLVHRALLGDEQPEDIAAVAANISEREYRSMICERTADEYTLMWLMRDQVGETLEGTVVSTAAFGLFVELETGATGLVHVSKLPGWWELEPNGVVLSNDAIGASYRVGDRVAGRIDRRSTAHAEGGAPDSQAFVEEHQWQISRATRKPCTTSTSRRPTRPASC